MSIFFFDTRQNLYEIKFDIDICDISNTLIKIPINFTKLFLSKTAIIRFVYKNLTVSTYKIFNLKHKKIQNLFIFNSDRFNLIINLTHLSLININELNFKITKSTINNHNNNQIFKNIQNLDFKNKSELKNTILSNNISNKTGLVINLKHKNDSCSIMLNNIISSSKLNLNFYLNSSIT